MAVKQEIKSHLAKLLATEDLVVEHKQCETAQFNVHTRVLTLPLWEKASDVVYDSLVCHEVGHALFTPDEDWTQDAQVPQQFINVVEDARIEKLMRRKYAGVAKTFYKGYKELHDKDFFELDGQNLCALNLADRANLHFKIGSHLELFFSTREEEILDMIADCETFEDVKKVSIILYEYCKDEVKQQEQVEKSKEGTQQELDLNQDAGDNQETTEEEVEHEVKEKTTSEGAPSSPIKNNEEEPEPELKTVESLESSIRDLVNDRDGARENVYLEVNDVNIDSIIASNEDIHKEIESDFKDQSTMATYELFNEVDKEYSEFKNSAKTEVNYLVKEFECKKSASAYARASVSKTGVLDTRNLHTYKFNEDLFKRISIVPDGKNHGLVFILDWSGSMSKVLTDTIKQLYNLLWFCRKVQIPFEVYAFSNEWKIRERDYDTGAWKIVDDFKEIYEPSEGVFHIDKAFTLMNIFTSKVKNNEFEKQLRNIYRTAWTFGHRWNIKYRPSARLHLSGTPLNETLISLHKIIPQFQKENKLEKVQCVILTDGEASTIPYHTEVQRRWEYEPIMGCRGINPDCCFLRDRKLGKVYQIGYRYYDFADVLIRNLQDTFPSTNFIGIRLVEPRDAVPFIRRYCNEYENPTEYAKIVSEWRKTKSFSITSSSYNSYFGMSSAVLSEDSEFEPKSDSKADIKRAFAKSLRTKKLNKKVLGEFIELVA